MTLDITSMDRGELEREVRRLRAIPTESISLISLEYAWKDLRHWIRSGVAPTLALFVDALQDISVHVDLGFLETSPLDRCQCAIYSRDMAACQTCNGEGVVVQEIPLFDPPADVPAKGE